MGPRRPHNKTRTGCAQCKKRRVKCDETKPSCQNCKRVDKLCSFLHTSSLRHTAAGWSQRPSHELPPLDQTNSFSLLDLKLLHHFTTSTSRTLSPQRSVQRLWQTTIIQLSFQHDFLLREILALSALHLAKTTPTGFGDDLSTLSLEFQTAALTSFREVVTTISPANCEALFAFALLLFYHVHGEQGGHVDRGDAEGLESDWIRMARGVRAVFNTSASWLEQSELAEVFAPISSRECVPLGGKQAKEYDAHLARLEELWDDFEDSEGEGEGEFDAEVYSEALFQLRLAYQRALAFDQADANPSARLRSESQAAAASASLTWLLSMPEAYLECLNRQEPQALIILAHYAVLLGRVRDTWWSTPTTHSLIHRVRSLTGAEWHTWLAWPVEKIFQE